MAGVDKKYTTRQRGTVAGSRVAKYMFMETARLIAHMERELCATLVGSILVKTGR